MSAVCFSDANHTTNLLITTSHLSPPILVLVHVWTSSLLPRYQQPQGRIKTEREKKMYIYQALIIDQGSVPMNLAEHACV